ncbi:MAG: M48 family peptidase [Gammaproteobacteria bacterium]|nr:M48 family peptidase [Gammaproteobacteria bacterium]
MEQQLPLDFSTPAAPTVEVLRSAKRRTISLEVQPNLRVILRAPVRCPQAVLQAFLRSRAAWMTQQLAHFRDLPPRPTLAPDAMASRQRLLGVEFAVRLAPEAPTGLCYEAGVLSLNGRHARDPQARARALIGWYRSQARTRFESLVDTWHAHPRFRRYARPPLKIRAMRSRWGSLSTRTGMTLNLLLIHAPLAAIEYVVVHELCHLRYRGHGRGFYGLLESVLPDWRARKLLLEASVA